MGVPHRLGGSVIMALMAFLQHGPCGGPYQTEAVKVKQTEAPQRGGGRPPSPYMVHVEGKWRRVYGAGAGHYIGRGEDQTPVTLQHFE